ncbi:MAG TPA: DNA repair protein RadA, partial [Xanthobacteraceae bacterium]
AVRPVAQTSARLKEAAKLGFGRAILPESARGDVGGDAGLSLNTVGGLTSLVAEIAARGTPRKGARQASDEGDDGDPRDTSHSKNASSPRFRRQER